MWRGSLLRGSNMDFRMLNAEETRFTLGWKKSVKKVRTGTAARLGKREIFRSRWQTVVTRIKGIRPSLHIGQGTGSNHKYMLMPGVTRCTDSCLLGTGSLSKHVNTRSKQGQRHTHCLKAYETAQWQICCHEEDSTLTLKGTSRR